MCECDNLGALKMGDVHRARIALSPYLKETPLEKNDRLSQKYGAEIYLKREDLQPVRSFKIRGALNFLLNLSHERRAEGVVCASAGNHAQGVSYACRLLNTSATIFVPKTTPAQKIEQIKYFSGGISKLVLAGKNFDECFQEASDFSELRQQSFVHPFDDYSVMAGQGTIALEVMSNRQKQFDSMVFPIGGGGLASGLTTVMKQLSPKTQLFGVEVEGSEAMTQSIEKGKRTALITYDTFADGTAVGQVGKLTFRICNDNLDRTFVVTKKEVSQAILNLYNDLGLIVEPSGALAFALLEKHREVFFGKKVVVIVSGANNEVRRLPEFLQLAG